MQKKTIAIISTTLIAIIIAIIACSSLSLNHVKNQIDRKELEEKQKQSLIAFFERTGGKYWINSTGWYSKPGERQIDYCKWFGISCGAVYGQVLKIDLSGNNLTANDFDLLTLSPLESLMVLHLDANNLHGDISHIIQSAHEVPNMHVLTMMFNPGVFGEVPIEVCYRNSPSNNFTLRVDCDVMCKCCAHEKLCIGMN